MDGGVLFGRAAARVVPAQRSAGRRRGGAPVVTSLAPRASGSAAAPQIDSMISAEVERVGACRPSECIREDRHCRRRSPAVR